MKKKMSKKKTQRGGMQWVQQQEQSNPLCESLKKILRNKEPIDNNEYQTLFVATKFEDFIKSINNNEDLFKNLLAISNLDDDEKLREILFRR